MKKNSLEARKKQHESLLENERREQERKARKQISRETKKVQQAEIGEVSMESSTKEKFKRRVLPRREYKAKRRQEKLTKYAPRILSTDGGDIDMGDINRPKKVIPVSKTLRLVKNKDSSISKQH